MIFVQTNEEQNAVVAFRRRPDGSLEEAGTFATGGAGDGRAHLPSQGSVTLAGDGRHLLVTNAGSDDVSLFAVAGDATLRLLSRSPAGPLPRSVAERDGLVYALSTAKAAVSGFRIGPDGLEPVGGGDAGLSAPDCDPAQVGFTADGAALVVTERGTDAITTFAVEAGGSLGAPRSVASSGPTPYGFACTAAGTLVVTEAFRAAEGAAAASSYTVRGATLTPVTASLGNGRSEICWVVATPDGRLAYATNFADGAVSCYAVGVGGGLSLLDAAAGVTADGRRGLRDEALAGDGRLLYALDADAAAVLGWAVEATGALVPLGSWGHLPATAAGLAAR